MRSAAGDRPRKLRDRNNCDAHAKSDPGPPVLRLKPEQEDRHNKKDRQTMEMNERQHTRDQTYAHRRKMDSIWKAEVPSSYILVSAFRCLCGEPLPQLTQNH